MAAVVGRVVVGVLGLAGRELLKALGKAALTTLATVGTIAYVEQVVEQCKECPARFGILTPALHSMSQPAREYQSRVTGFPQFQEWFYNFVLFDGLKAPCILLEAKYNYENFLDPAKDNKDWQPWFSGAQAMLAQAIRQSAAAVPRPPVSLMWCFSNAEVMAVMKATFSTFGLSHIITAHMP